MDPNKEVTQEILDLIVPNHGRTSCNDTSLSNYCQNDSGLPRCNRCYLMTKVGQKFGELAVQFKLAAEVRFEEKTVVQRTIIFDT